MIGCFCLLIKAMRASSLIYVFKKLNSVYTYYSIWRNIIELIAVVKYILKVFMVIVKVGVISLVCLNQQIQTNVQANEFLSA
jgi:hypothetical protein